MLNSLSVFMLSFFEVPREVLERLDFYQSRFYWQSDSHKRKYTLVKQSVVCTPKELSGLGIQNSNAKNKCLLKKWLFKLLNEEGVCQFLLTRKYMGEKSLSQVINKLGTSQFWTGPMKIKDLFLRFGSFQVKNKIQTRFQEDIWLDESSLKRQYPTLYNVARTKNDTMATFMGSNSLQISFRRPIIRSK